MRNICFLFFLSLFSFCFAQEYFDKKNYVDMIQKSTTTPPAIDQNYFVMQGYLQIMPHENIAQIARKSLKFFEVREDEEEEADWKKLAFEKDVNERLKLQRQGIETKSNAWREIIVKLDALDQQEIQKQSQFTSFEATKREASDRIKFYRQLLKRLEAQQEIARNSLKKMALMKKEYVLIYAKLPFTYEFTDNHTMGELQDMIINYAKSEAARHGGVIFLKWWDEVKNTHLNMSMIECQVKGSAYATRAGIFYPVSLKDTDVRNFWGLFVTAPKDIDNNNLPNDANIVPGLKGEPESCIINDKMDLLQYRSLLGDRFFEDLKNLYQKKSESRENLKNWESSFNKLINMWNDYQQQKDQVNAQLLQEQQNFEYLKKNVEQTRSEIEEIGTKRAEMQKQMKLAFCELLKNCLELDFIIVDTGWTSLTRSETRNNAKERIFKEVYERDLELATKMVIESLDVVRNSILIYSTIKEEKVQPALGNCYVISWVLDREIKPGDTDYRVGLHIAFHFRLDPTDLIHILEFKE